MYYFSIRFPQHKHTCTLLECTRQRTLVTWYSNAHPLWVSLRRGVDVGALRHVRTFYTQMLQPPQVLDAVQRMLQMTLQLGAVVEGRTTGLRLLSHTYQLCHSFLTNVLGP